MVPQLCFCLLFQINRMNKFDGQEAFEINIALSWPELQMCGKVAMLCTIGTSEVKKVGER